MLAIIIPYYKLTFFEETLKSLSGQTDNRFKVYIGNDASPEDPKMLLEKYQGKFDFCYHKFEENLGGKSLTQQWERCIALSSAEEWLMILGDDDVLGENVVESFYTNQDVFMGKTNVIRFASQLLYEPEKSKSKVYVHPVWETATDAFYRKFSRITMSSLSEYMFTRKAFEKHGFHDYPLAWNSDDRAWLDFSDHQPIFSINKSLVFPRMSNLNITGKGDNWKLKNESSVAFYHFLIQKKLNHYSKYQRIKIVRKYYFELKKVKALNARDWLFIIENYVCNLNSQAIKSFLKKYI